MSRSSLKSAYPASGTFSLSMLSREERCQTARGQDPGTSSPKKERTCQEDPEKYHFRPIAGQQADLQKQQGNLPAQFLRRIGVLHPTHPLSPKVSCCFHYLLIPKVKDRETQSSPKDIGGCINAIPLSKAKLVHCA